MISKIRWSKEAKKIALRYGQVKEIEMSIRSINKIGGRLGPSSFGGEKRKYVFYQHGNPFSYDGAQIRVKEKNVKKSITPVQQDI